MISEREIVERLSFAAEIENVSLAEGLVDRICESQSIKEDAYGNVLIAITEAVNNAIIHGSGLDGSKEVNIDVLKTNDDLVFKIVDSGSGFDFNNLEDPTDPKNIEKPNGRGIFLMKNLADNVEYFNNGSTVELTFKI